MAAITPTRQRHPAEETPFFTSSSPAAEVSVRFETNSSPAQEHEQENDPRSSPKRYTFTPQRTRPVPRAWERRPATPFLPRTGAQRIWKRVPLEVIAPGAKESWNKGNPTLYTRPVKRLRVSQFDQEEDKENIEYVGSKWDEDGVLGVSPKRKAIGVAAYSQRHVDFVDDETPHEENSDREEDEVLTKVPGHAMSVDSGAIHSTPDARIEIGNDGDIGANTPSGVSGNVTVVNHGEDCVQSGALPSEPTEASPRPLSSSTTATSPSQRRPTSSPQQEESPKENQTERPSPARCSPLGQHRPAESTTLSTDQDDTAYLHDFLSRARAQKAAKQQSDSHDLVSTGAVESIEELSAGPTSLHAGDMPGGATMTPPASLDDVTNLLTDQEPEATVISPCRRSPRLVTRLPRPQKTIATLPSSIALKRLNGSEFIATQREAQSLAFATRSNTKTNKGAAVAVRVKLIQLHAEAKANVQRGDLEIPEWRKMKKDPKEVAWDPTIARFQDGSGVQLSSLDEDDAETTVVREGGDEGDQHKEEKATQDSAKEKTQVKKVRKLRKLNIGTVNGTPAPKRNVSLPVPTPVEKMIRRSGPGSSVDAAEPIPPKEQLMRTRTRTRKP